MTDYNDTPIGSGYNTNAAINTELSEIAVAIRTKMDKSGTTMSGDLDMNSNNILNVSALGTQALSIAGVQVTTSGVVTTTLPSQAGHNGEFLTTDGATASWVPNVSSVINVIDHGATGDGSTDDSVAIQAAVDAAGNLGLVFFPKADVEYVFGTTIAIPGGQTWQGEIDWTSTRTPTSGASLLRYTGTTQAITCAEVQWINIILTGNINSTVAPNIGTGITNTGNLRLVASTLRGFAKLVSSTGGFYHVFDRCTFFHANTCLDFSIINNANFNLCRFVHFDIGVSGSGGAGFVNFNQCAMEKWTDKLVAHLAGAIFAVSYDQGYIENYPTEAIKTGLTDVGGTGNYDLALGFTHGRTVSITKSLVSMKGIKRLIAGTADEATFMKGNSLIMFAAGASIPNESDAIVSLSGQPELLVMEDSYQFIDGSGATTTFALSGLLTDQITVTTSLGKEFRYLDYEGNIITSGKRKISETGDRTLTIQDYGKFIAVNKASAAVITIPTLPAGWWCEIQQESVNSMTFVAGTGLSFLNPSAERGAATSERYSVVEVQMSRTNSCTLSGDLVSSPIANSTKMGENALSVATGISNTAYGFQAGESITTGIQNVIIGKNACQNGTIPDDCVFIGNDAGKACDGDDNTFIGSNSGELQTTGINCTALGSQTLKVNLTGDNCTAIGVEALVACLGANNTVLGASSGQTITTGSDNTMLGFNCEPGSATATNRIVMGSGITGTANDQFSFGKLSNVVSNDFGTDALFSRASDRKLKTNIKYNGSGLDFICSLKVGSWNWKDGYDRCTTCTVNGLIYDEVEASERQFGSWGLLDSKGDFNGLKYEGLIMPLINAIQELKARIEELENK